MKSHNTNDDDFQQDRGERLLRLSSVLKLIPVSSSTWWSGVKEGKFPQPVKLSKRVTAWRETDIRALMD